MLPEQGKAPLPLDYEAHLGKRFWPQDPFAASRVTGFAGGFFVPFLGMVWNHWTDGIIRVPLLWYQHEWWIGVAAALLVALIMTFIKTKFVFGFVAGVGVAFLILIINRQVNAWNYGANPLGRLTGYWIS